MLCVYRVYKIKTNSCRKSLMMPPAVRKKQITHLHRLNTQQQVQLNAHIKTDNAP